MHTISTVHYLMKIGNGQSKYCTHGPTFIIHVIRSVIASLLNKNILFWYYFDWTRSSDPTLARVFIVHGSVLVFNRPIIVLLFIQIVSAYTKYILFSKSQLFVYFKNFTIISISISNELYSYKNSVNSNTINWNLTSIKQKQFVFTRQKITQSFVLSFDEKRFPYHW